MSDEQAIELCDCEGLREALRELIGTVDRRRAVELGLRILSPGREWPTEAHRVDAGGIEPPKEGVFRPQWRPQDPAVDKFEPFGDESDSKAHDHGWANCNMSSAAVLYSYHLEYSGPGGPWGGHMRHHQDDREGGTDLYDAKTAWQRYGGQNLVIRSGQGWNGIKEARKQGRAILIQGGDGVDVPGKGSFSGAHSCVIGPEIHEKTGDWLFGDPLANDWQYIAPGNIRNWAESLSSGILFAVSNPVTGAETD
jgi:hypothetical protein